MNNSDAEILLETHKIVLELAEKIKPVIENPMEISSQELGLNLKTILNGKGPLLSQDAEAYRELIIGLNEKLKVLLIALNQIEMLSAINQKLLNEKSIREEQEKKNIEKFENLQKNQEKKFLELVESRNKAFEELNSLKNQLENSKLCEDELKIEVDSLKSELEAEKNKTKNFAGLETLIFEKNKNKSQDLEDFQSLKLSLLQKLEEFDKAIKENDEELNSIMAENESLKNSLLTAENVIKSLENEKSEKNSEISQLESMIKSNEAEMRAFQELKETNQEIGEQLEKLQKLNKTYEASIENLTSDVRNLNQLLSSEKEKTNSKIQSLHNKSLQQENLIKSNQDKIKQLEDELFNQTSSNEFLKKRLSASNGSLRSVCQEMKKFQQELFENQQKTESELEFIANYTLKSSQDHLEQERNMKKLGEIVLEKDSELNILREMIGELQKPKPSYFPIKDDPVDQALADFINNRPEPMEINFIREDYGTYLFGSKRVFIKIENGKIISKIYAVRVGGGFMRIDEFVECYTPLEVEKLDERKKFENTPSRKNSLGKLGSMCKA